MKKIHIYTLSDPSTKSPRYVGLTRNLGARKSAHLLEDGESPKCKWVSYLRSKKMRPEFDVLETVEESDAAETERFYINYFRFLGIDLLNVRAGGEMGKPKTQEEIDFAKDVYDFDFLVRYFPRNLTSKDYGPVFQMLNCYGNQRSQIRITGFSKLRWKARRRFYKEYKNEMSEASVKYLSVNIWYPEI